MEKIEKPFSKEQVRALNDYQQRGWLHPFTCSGRPSVLGEGIDEFVDAPTINACSRKNCPDEGVLIATEDGWVCPCGIYRQSWAHKFMAEDPNAIISKII